jgi:hypothetical protein
MKKILSIVLVAMLVIGMAPMAFASPTSTPSLTSTITQENSSGAIIGTYGYSSGLKTGYPTENFLNMTTEDLGSDASPTNTTFDYGLGVAGWYEPTAAQARAEYFIDNTGNATPGKKWAFVYDGYTRKSIADEKVTAQLRVTSGQRVVDKIEILYMESVTDPDGVKWTFAKDEQPAYLRITFNNKFVSTSTVDYKFMAYLNKNKRRDQDTEVNFEGSYKNAETTVDEGDSYVYLSTDIPVVESLAYIKNIDIELDDGITIHTKFFKGKKYYATGSAGFGSADDETLTQYPDIDAIYTLESVGLNNAYTTVSLNVGGSLPVYNADLEYIGTTADKLPFSSKYYVAATELDIASSIEEPAEEPTTDPGDGFDPGANMGGDNSPANSNDNPGTGC